MSKTIYAATTSVPVDRTQAEIKKTLTKYGASAFMFAEGTDKAQVAFEMSGRKILFRLPLPLKPEKGSWTQGQREQMVRTRWRALLLGIKAKLECVNSGITTLEQEFLAHIMLPNGQTMGDVSIPQIAESYRSGNMPPLLGGSC